mmetsp:Transcript_14635/g.21379  ORF Transcript_14635/g.21379 Transcript_14635/m.21379 type:complete len:357 (-) Transcript_14635:824-1894(-)
MSTIESYTEINAWLVGWFCLIVVVLLVPFCATQQRRRLCFSRLRERRWNVEVEENNDGWFAGALERYNAAVARENQNSNFGREHEDKVSSFILERANGFSIVLNEDDFCSLCMDGHPIMDGSNLKSDNEEKCAGEEKSVIGTTIESEKEISPECCTLEDEERQVEKSPSDETKTTASTDETENNREVVSIDVGDSLSIESGGMKDQDCILQSESFASGTGPHTHIIIPLPGVIVSSQETLGSSRESRKRDLEDGTNTTDTVIIADKERVVSKFCAICLSEFEKDQSVCWSSNSSCPHAFHTECILNWYTAISKKTYKRRQREGIVDIDETQFPMLCPCCRQDFLPTSPKEDADEEV